jgi:hypothetical protein
METSSNESIEQRVARLESSIAITLLNIDKAFARLSVLQFVTEIDVAARFSKTSPANAAKELDALLFILQYRMEAKKVGPGVEQREAEMQPFLNEIAKGFIENVKTYEARMRQLNSDPPPS